jgi:hypothetical protein
MFLKLSMKFPTTPLLHLLPNLPTIIRGCGDKFAPTHCRDFPALATYKLETSNFYVK